MSNVNELYEKAIEKWGKPLQFAMAIEEMAELTKEIVKHLRGKGNKKHLAEEIADVQIMLDQLKVMLDNNRDVLLAYESKLRRLEQMLK